MSSGQPDVSDPVWWDSPAKQAEIDRHDADFEANERRTREHTE